MKFYDQRKSQHADCMPRALANACVELKRPHPIPDSPDWEDVIVLAGCLHGAALLEVDELAPYFGLEAERVDVMAIRGIGPLILTVHNPCVGTSLHSVLVTRWFKDKARVVNYRTDSKRLIERLPVSYDAPPSRSTRWDRIYIPDHPNDRAYLIRPGLSKWEDRA